MIQFRKIKIPSVLLLQPSAQASSPAGAPPSKSRRKYLNLLAFRRLRCPGNLDQALKRHLGFSWKKCFFTFVLFAQSLGSAKTWADAASAAEFPVAQKNAGYLVIKLDIGSNFARVKLSGNRKDADIILKPNANGYLILSLPKGNYVIDELQVPYFDYPFRLDLTEDPRWQFRINPQTINYLGELYIGPLRGYDAVDYYLKNRTAVNRLDFCDRYHKQCQQLPFRFAASYRDDFLDTATEGSAHE